MGLKRNEKWLFAKVTRHLCTNDQAKAASARRSLTGGSTRTVQGPTPAVPTELGRRPDAAWALPGHQRGAVVLHPPRPWGRLSGTQEGSWGFTKHWKLSERNEAVGGAAPRSQQHMQRTRPGEEETPQTQRIRERNID